MVQMIEHCKCLQAFLHRSFEDSGISVPIASRLMDHEYIGIKIDDYYNSFHLKRTPKSIDFLVAVDCSCNAFVLFLLEFRNITSPSKLNPKEIAEKFDNTISDFICSRYSDIFISDKFKYKSIFLYLVSDMYRRNHQFETHADFIRHRERHSRVACDSLKADVTLSQSLFTVKNIICTIKYAMPSEILIDKITE